MSTNKYKEIKECRCCGSSELKEILDLNTQPLANSYHTGKEALPTYPLALNLCTNCFHLQLSVVVDPDEMFSNYLYVSGTTKTLHDYFEWFADMVEHETGKLPYPGKVLDIACNDGTQLQKFLKKSWLTHGIDPAKNLYELSSKNAAKVVVDYFNKSSLEKLGGVKYDAILAQNVFAHTDNIVEFLENCKSVMHPHTKLYIQTSQADMVENIQFDTIYHEHLSFFSTRSMIEVCKRVGLNVVSVKRVSVHGGSYIFTISKVSNSDGSVEDSLKKETTDGRYTIETYDQYAKEVRSIIKDFNDTIEFYRTLGYLLVGYGAAAKGNTFLNASETKLHFIIDDNEKKHGLLTPGSNTMIVDKNFIDHLANNVLFIPLAWNFYEEIKEKIKNKVSTLPFKALFDYKTYSYYPTKNIENI